ncbi:hypothetical protein ACHAQA_002012 [Verticillium albo-atrum]
MDFGKNLDRISNLTRLILFDPPSTFEPTQTSCVTPRFDNMRPTQILRGGGGLPKGKFNHFLGDWGNIGGERQRGIITFGLSANRQNPFAGAGHDAVFNTFRRFRGSVLYVVPPLVAAYYAMDWAIHRNEYLNSKAGLAEFADSEEE